MSNGDGGPLKPARATEVIRNIARGDPKMDWKAHAREQMLARDLLVGDAMHVLKFGFVHEEAEPASQNGFYKYRMEYATPNSNGRSVRVIVIPSVQQKALKVVTVMWADEPLNRG